MCMNTKGRIFPWKHFGVLRWWISQETHFSRPYISICGPFQALRRPSSFCYFQAWPRRFLANKFSKHGWLSRPIQQVSWNYCFALSVRLLICYDVRSSGENNFRQFIKSFLCSISVWFRGLTYNGRVGVCRMLHWTTLALYWPPPIHCTRERWVKGPNCPSWMSSASKTLIANVCILASLLPTG